MKYIFSIFALSFVLGSLALAFPVQGERHHLQAHEDEYRISVYSGGECVSRYEVHGDLEAKVDGAYLIITQHTRYGRKQMIVGNGVKIVPCSGFGVKIK